MLDELVNKLFDFHFLEAKVEYVEKIKARKLIKKLELPSTNPIKALKIK